MFTAFSQYFIKAPLVAITASSLFDYDATFLAFLVLGSFSHSSLQNLWNSIEFDGECNCTAIFRPLQKYSIGFKSGLWLGQLRIFRAVPNPLLCYDACVLKVVVLLEDELEPDESEVQSTGCLQTWHLELMSNSSIFVLSDQRIPSSTFLRNSRQAAMCLFLWSGFSLASLPFRPDQWSVLGMVVALTYTATMEPYIDRCVPFQIIRFC